MNFTPNNPHPPYDGNDTVIDTREFNCVSRYIPNHLRENPLYKKVSELMCHYETKWTDAEIRMYLHEASEFFRTGDGGLALLNWYSLINWVQAAPYDWYTQTTGAGFDSDDFYQKYPLSTKEIWLSMSAANKQDFNEDGFDYWQWTLEPYVGTNLIQRKLLEKLESEAEIIDWYHNDNIVNAYEFLYDEFPGWEKAKLLIIGSKLLKNAESILISIKDSNCPNRFILSHSYLDTDYLSDITALKFEGVHICFQRYNSTLIKDGFEPLKDIWRLYTRIHKQMVEYFVIKKLSSDLILDDLRENKIFNTKYSVHKGKFVQLLPSTMFGTGKWDSGMTWEDHFEWGDINITNLVRVHLDKEREPLYWDSGDTWDRWIGWEGDPEDWTYMKPGCDRTQYYTDSNFITGFEPLTLRSFYKPLVKSKITRDYDETAFVFTNNKKVINMWGDPFILSKTLEFDNDVYKVVQSKYTREDTSNHYESNVNIWGDLDWSEGVDIYKLTTLDNKVFEHITSSEAVAWDEYTSSGTLELDEEVYKTVYEKKTSEES